MSFGNLMYNGNSRVKDIISPGELRAQRKIQSKRIITHATQTALISKKTDTLCSLLYHIQPLLRQSF